MTIRMDYSEAKAWGDHESLTVVFLRSMAKIFNIRLLIVFSQWFAGDDSGTDPGTRPMTLGMRRGRCSLLAIPQQLQYTDA